MTREYGDATSQTLAVEMNDADGKASTQVIFVNDTKDHVRTIDFKRGILELSDDGMYITRKLAHSLKPASLPTA